jgi:hypothetical protein
MSISMLLISILTAVKVDLHDTSFSRSGVNQMRILKKIKRLDGDLSFKSYYICTF